MFVCLLVGALSPLKHRGLHQGYHIYTILPTPNSAAKKIEFCVCVIVTAETSFPRLKQSLVTVQRKRVGEEGGYGNTEREDYISVCP